jgi:hypothetical protein
MVNIVDLQTMTEIDRSTLQARFPGTSFPQDQYLNDAVLKPFGCATFTIDPQPIYSPFTSIAPGSIQQNADGTYSLHWIQTDAPLDQAQQGLLSQVQQLYNRALQSPIIHGGQYVFSLKWDTIVFLRESVAANEVVSLSDNQGNWIQLQPSEAATLANTISGAMRAINMNMYAHVTAINALPDITSAKAYDISTGWPT